MKRGSQKFRNLTILNPNFFGGWNGVHVCSELPGTLVRSYILECTPHTPTLFQRPQIIGGGAGLRGEGWTKKYKFQKQFSNLPFKQFVSWNRLMILLHFCRKYYFTHLWTRSLQRLLLHLHLRDICSVRTGAEKIGKFDKYSHILMGQKMLAVCSTCSRFWANLPPSNPMKFS